MKKIIIEFPTCVINDGVISELTNDPTDFKKDFDTFENKVRKNLLKKRLTK